MRRIMTTVAIFGAILLGVHANATTYVGTRTVDGQTIGVSITTDGTIGTLKSSNITAFDVTIPTAAGTEDIDQVNGFVAITGSDFSATATSLIYDFSGNGGYALFDSHQSFTGFYCLDSGTSCYFGSPGPGEGVFNGSAVYSAVESGPTVIASTAGAGAVPEPATWSMMIGGFGLTGGALRRNRRGVVALAA